MTKKKVLIIDDSYDITRVLRSAIYTIDPKIEVAVTPSAEEATLEISKGGLDLIITDIRLPGISGLELLRKVREKHPDVKIIMMSGMDDQDLDKKARGAGADIFLRKPIEMPVFLDTVSEILGFELSKTNSTDGLVPDFELMDDEDFGKNLAESMTSLRKEISASHVWLLSEYGRLAAQSGESDIVDFETKWAPYIMPILSASESFTQTITGKRPDRAVISIGISDSDVFMIPLGDYALVIRVPTGRGTKRIPIIVDVLLEYQQEILSILSRMGVLPLEDDNLTLEEMDDTQLVNTFLKEEGEEEGEDEDLKVLLESKTALPEVDEFWNEADIGTAYDLDNPEILSFDQASKLGLTPDEEE